MSEAISAATPMVVPGSALMIELAKLTTTRFIIGMLTGAVEPAKTKKTAEYFAKEAGNLIERWLLAMANSPGGGLPYRDSHPNEPLNVKLAKELQEKKFVKSPDDAKTLVIRIIKYVDLIFDVGVDVSTEEPTVVATDKILKCGEGFSAEMTPRLAELVRMRGERAAALVAIRYATLVSTGQQWGIPYAHADHLWNEFGVRNEGFASPLNSRVLGKPGAAFCSLFPDVDGPFGSIGSFFNADLSRPGNWTVNPPYTESVMEAAARRVVEYFARKGAPPKTFFYIGPDWYDAEAYKLLKACPFLVAEVVLSPGQYYYEDNARARVNTRATSVYMALSSEGVEVTSRLAEALRHMTQI